RHGTAQVVRRVPKLVENSFRSALFKRDGEFYDRSAVVPGNGLNVTVVGFHDRAADRKTHTDAVGLGSEKRFKDLFAKLGRKSGATILDTDQEFILLVPGRGQQNA